MKRLVIGAHPDDIDVMLGYALEDSLTLVATDGEAGINVTDTCSCTG